VETISPSSGWISLSKNSSFPTSEAAWQKQSKAWKHSKEQLRVCLWGLPQPAVLERTAPPIQLRPTGPAGPELQQELP